MLRDGDSSACIPLRRAERCGRVSLTLHKTMSMTRFAAVEKFSADSGAKNFLTEKTSSAPRNATVTSRCNAAVRRDRVRRMTSPRIASLDAASANAWRVCPTKVALRHRSFLLVCLLYSLGATE